MNDEGKPSPWIEQPAPAPTPKPGPFDHIREHDLLVSIGLGMLLGGGAVLLLGGLLAMLS